MFFKIKIDLDKVINVQLIIIKQNKGKTVIVCNNRFKSCNNNYIKLMHYYEIVK